MVDAKARVVLEKLGLNHFIRKFDSKNITNYFIPKLTPKNFKCLAIGNQGTIMNLSCILESRRFQSQEQSPRGVP